MVLLREGIAAEDKARLARQFWSSIGLGKEPAVALEEAMGCCAPGVKALALHLQGG